MVVTIKTKEPPAKRWVVTMGNGRTFLVFTENKANIARKCGYNVEELRYGTRKRTSNDSKT